MPFEHAHSPLHTEVDAFKAGLILGIQQGWKDIDIESDFILLVAALGREEEDLSDMECKEYMRAFQTIRIRHIGRETNGVANRLAHLASRGFLDDVWLGETPANTFSMRILVILLL
ncbi:hypothetical protein ACLB2K_072951 [Fragaria x ananassa]